LYAELGFVNFKYWVYLYVEFCIVLCKMNCKYVRAVWIGLFEVLYRHKHFWDYCMLC